MAAAPIRDFSSASVAAAAFSFAIAASTRRVAEAQTTRRSARCTVDEIAVLRLASAASTSRRDACASDALRSTA
eukprot:6212740-Pleurochrysis_carterae.AAC.3